jgi:hypothetical protein
MEIPTIKRSVLLNWLAHHLICPRGLGQHQVELWIFFHATAIIKLLLFYDTKLIPVRLPLVA